MNILVLKSSGNKKGSSNILADEFIRGAQEAGHSIREYDVIRKDIRPCIGCNVCGMNDPCVQNTSMTRRLSVSYREKIQELPFW